MFSEISCKSGFQGKQKCYTNQRCSRLDAVDVSYTIVFAGLVLNAFTLQNSLVLMQFVWHLGGRFE